MIARIKKLLNKYEFLTPLAVFIFSLFYLGYIQWSPYIADPDSFYHIKLSILISKLGIIYNFPYLPFTVLKNIFIDHHLLYHVFLIPFTTLLPPIIGAKISQVLLASILVVVFYWLLKKLGVKWPIFFTLALLTCSTFIFRISLIKAQPTSLIILFIGLFLIFKRKYLLLALISFIYVWTYGGWIFLPAFCAIFVFVDCLDYGQKTLPSLLSIVKKSQAILFIKTFFQRLFSRQSLSLLISCGLGVLAGLIINPYFPKNIQFYWIQIFQIPFSAGSKIALGTEWHSMSQYNFIVSLFLPIIIICLSSALIFIYRPKLETNSKFLLLISTIFIFATIKSQRNVEYLAPILIITSAMILTQIFKNEKFQEDLNIVKKYISLNIKLNFILLVLAVSFLSYICVTAVSVKKSSSIKKSDRFELASKYIASNSNPGDIIYHSSWDEFPPLFYFNDQARYISGLDPTFMYLNDKDLYQKTDDILFGKRSEEVYDIIKNDFKARFVFTIPKWTKFITSLDKDPRFQKVYSDDNSIVYKVL